MELYFQSRSTVHLNLGVDADLVLGVYQVFLTVTKVSDNTVVVNNATATRDSAGVYSYTLSEANTNALGLYKQAWTYTITAVTTTKLIYHNVVVGYVSADTLKTTYPELASKTDDEIYRKEVIARKIINTFCNQSFDFETAVTKKIEGKYSNRLWLPRLIYTLTSVKIENTDDITANIELVDGYFIRPVPDISFTDVKRDIIFGSTYFKQGINYYVLGDWGWRYVPESIVQATMLLIKDYFDDDTLLRQHGIWQANFGDTSYQLRQDFWATTGNYDVDLLINPYCDPMIQVL